MFRSRRSIVLQLRKKFSSVPGKPEEIKKGEGFHGWLKDNYYAPILAPILGTAFITTWICNSSDVRNVASMLLPSYVEFLRDKIGFAHVEERISRVW